jgi:hypothetical protein
VGMVGKLWVWAEGILGNVFVAIRCFNVILPVVYVILT